MIVCSCTVITDKELKQAAEAIKNEPGQGIVTPGAVFRYLGKRPKCGTCFPMIVHIIHAMAEKDRRGSGQ
ncbi:MAG: (2Fe-2S)-binding protein [Phycisphaerales bacterium]|nr:(2Fe-2S)-binding protein [Phycisphaerales bacterium]